MQLPGNSGQLLQMAKTITPSTITSMPLFLLVIGLALSARHSFANGQLMKLGWAYVPGSSLVPLAVIECNPLCLLSKPDT